MNEGAAPSPAPAKSELHYMRPGFSSITPYIVIHCAAQLIDFLKAAFARTDIHLYVDDADVTYARALQAGARPIYEVADQPWGDRQGAVQDPFGKHWYIAMVKGWTPGPEGIRTVQPYLH